MRISTCCHQTLKLVRGEWECTKCKEPAGAISQTPAGVDRYKSRPAFRARRPVVDDGENPLNRKTWQHDRETWEWEHYD